MRLTHSGYQCTKSLVACVTLTPPKVMTVDKPKTGRPDPQRKKGLMTQAQILRLAQEFNCVTNEIVEQYLMK